MSEITWLISQLKTGAAELSSGALGGLTLTEIAVKDFSAVIGQIDTEGNSHSLNEAQTQLFSILDQIDSIKTNLAATMNACDQWVRAVSEE